MLNFIKNTTLILEKNYYYAHFSMCLFLIC
jgi:hypothetical protein